MLVANTAPSGIGWPEERFEGLTEAEFRDLIEPGIGGAAATEPILVAQTEAEIKPEIGFAKDV